MSFFRLFSPQKSSPGQNLTEFALTVPFLAIFFLFIIEVGHAWWTYEAVKMAATDASVTAAIFHNENAGQARGQQKLTRAGIIGTVTVTKMPNQHAYQSSATGTFQPWLLGTITLPFIGTVGLGQFDLSYTALKENAVY